MGNLGLLIFFVDGYFVEKNGSVAANQTVDFVEFVAHVEVEINRVERQGPTVALVGCQGAEMLHIVTGRLVFFRHLLFLLRRHFRAFPDVHRLRKIGHSEVVPRIGEGAVGGDEMLALADHGVVLPQVKQRGRADESESVVGCVGSDGEVGGVQHFVPVSAARVILDQSRKEIGEQRIFLEAFGERFDVFRRVIFEFVGVGEILQRHRIVSRVLQCQINVAERGLGVLRLVAAVGCPIRRFGHPLVGLAVVEWLEKRLTGAVDVAVEKVVCLGKFLFSDEINAAIKKV